MLRYSSKMMNNEEIFTAWAPDESPWSRWAKPILFAHLDLTSPHIPISEKATDVHWAPNPSEKMALVLDLPGAEGVLTGVSLATKGYRLVPLYNALPVPFGYSTVDLLTGKGIAAVDVLPTIAALRNSAEQMARLTLPLDAPPAFLLDSNRQGDGRKMEPDEFDNRSISFATDFPSAHFLASQGIERVLLVQNKSLVPQSDLAHTLCRWQDQGVKIEALRLDIAARPEIIHIARPSWFGAMFQRALASIGFRRAKSGGFGAWMPESSSGG
jgi:hypothetical protein